MTKRLNRATIFLLFCILFISKNLRCQSFNLEGQVSGWTTFNDSDPARTQIGIRYIPHLDISQAIGERYFIDAELSANMYGTGLMRTVDDIDTNGKTKPYRLWLRFSGTQLEIRLGLQKINFGSASLLRPLMWFDRIDPRDPLQLTDGVYGALFRYYFLNNANIWLWGLYGNEDTKGWEVVPSDDSTIEYGGRFQYPVPIGEIALSYHHREMDLTKGLHALIEMMNEDIPRELLSRLIIADKSVPEDRFALDAKCDMEIGVWFEGVLMHQDIDFLPMNYQRLITIGCDYTFSIGNGLNALGEHLILEFSEKSFDSGERFESSALSLNYPIGLMDIISGIFYYDWENDSWYRFINWQRTYDNWRFYLIGFWNPEQFQIYQGQEETNTFAGKGIQLMVVYNH